MKPEGFACRKNLIFYKKPKIFRKKFIIIQSFGIFSYFTHLSEFSKISENRPFLKIVFFQESLVLVWDEKLISRERKKQQTLVMTEY